MAAHNGSTTEPRIGKTIREDFHNVKIKEDMGYEYRELKEYFLTDDHKDKLKSMSKFKKFFIIPWWLLRALYFKLTPFRRLLLIFGIILLFLAIRSNSSSQGITIDIEIPAILGGLVFLFIIALELKDKMYAKTELEEGRAVQIALMPEVHPDVAGWDIWLYTSPANDVGGDLLDFIKLSDDKVGISVGDVAGKGLSAALLMAKLQSTIRAIVPDYISLSELGNKLNRIFYRDSLPRLFASLLYSEIETKSGVIRLLNAGHLPPLLVRDKQIEYIKNNSPALGLIPEAKFKEQKVELDQNDLFIIYSDGLTEARNEEGEFFGEKRMRELLKDISNLSSEKLGEKILTELSGFKGKAKAHDDLTIAILKREP